MTLLLLIACHAPGLPAGTTSDPSESIPGDTSAPDTGPDSGDNSGLPPTGEVLITEVMAANHDTLEDGDGDSVDWIELYNAGGATIDLAGWGLSDDPDIPFLWTFPATAVPPTTLVPGEFRVVFASGKGLGGPTGELHTSFALDAAGETVTLTRPDARPSDILAFPALGTDVTYGRVQTVTTAQPVADGTAARLSIAPPDGWQAPTFVETTWRTVTLGLGYDGSVTGAAPEDAALEKPTTQSSDGYGLTGAPAVDGEPGTFSHTGDADLDPWWQVDLEAPYLVSGVTLLNRSDCCAERLYNVTVSLLDTSGSVVWRSDVQNPVSDGTAPTSPGSRLDVAPDAPVTARYARIDKYAVNGAYSSEWLSLAEVVVNGSLAAPYSDAIMTDIGPEMFGTSAVAAIRVPIPAHTLPFATPPSRAMLGVRFDDGFTAWLNGVAVATTNAGEGVATGPHDGSTLVTFPVDPTLLPSPALLAIEGQNVAADDDDFLLRPTLTLDWIETGAPAFFETPTPGEPNGAGIDGYVAEPTADPPRGFYDDALAVTVTAPTPGSTLVYTLDGTLPTLTHGTAVSPPDAGSTASVVLLVATTALLQAVAFRDGWATSRVATHTYVYLDDVVRQPAAPSGLPLVWDGVSEGPYDANYEMDPEIVDDPAYQADLLAGLRSIPTLSVVMDPADLWGTDGIYIHSAERGDAWTRRASVELILPDGSTGFQEACDIEIHGWGWRYHSSTLKHSFRLQFKQEYGAAKLEYPWFVDAPVDRFDSIVLRAGGSKTWLDFRDPAQAQYLHDAFARDTARAMGKVDGHATFVHLYLNGLYWGLYDPVERPDAGFGEEYFGGDDADYDAINRRTTTNEAIDGDLEAYNTLLALADADLSRPANYAAVEAMLDLDDLIDYMLIHQYTVNRDGPCCFESNNMRGIRKREDGAQFRFFVWDMEYSLWDATDPTNVDIDVAGAIAHVYTRLRENPMFTARYAARARMHLTGDGALTPAATAARYEARANEIYDPLVAESARWGDTYREVPYTRDVEWADEYTRLMDDYFPNRTEQLIEQLTAAGLYSP